MGRDHDDDAQPVNELAETATVSGARASGAGADASVSRLGPGAKLGAYSITRQLGHGAMGVVFEGVHETLGRHAAIKVLRDYGVAGGEAVQRFVREGQAASRIRHPNIVDVIDAGLVDGTPFLVMELLEGEDMASLMERETSLPAERIADLMIPVLCGLAAAHDNGIVHRDLKPSNIYLALGKGGTITPKIVDFGISKTVETSQTGALTATSALLGTPFYMSPEQVVSSKHVDARSDQYSAGVMLYEALAGARPFRQDSMLALLTSISNGDHRPLAEVVPGVAPALAAAVHRAMSTSPDDRFPSVRDLARELLPFAGERVRVLHTPEVTAPQVGIAAFATAPTVQAFEASSLVASARTANDPAPSRSKAWVKPVAYVGVAACVGLAVFASWRLGRSEGTVVPVATGAAVSAPMQSASAAPASSAPDRDAGASSLFPYFRCDQQDAGGEGQCAAKATAWCDKAQRRVACCGGQLIPRAPEAACVCPPGGVKAGDGGATSCLVATMTTDEYSKTIQATVRANYQEMRKCYEAALRISPTVAGKLQVAATIGADGRVLRAHISNVTVPDADFQSCVLRIYRTLQFLPPPGGMVTFQYPISFTPE